MKKILLTLLVGILLISTIVSAQDLQQTLNQLAGDAAKGYIKPVSQGFLTNFNGGLFHKAPQSKLFGIDFEVGVAVMATPFKDDDKTLPTTSGKFTFNKSQADDIAKDLNVADGVVDPIEAQFSAELQKQKIDINISGPTVIGKPYDPSDPKSEVILEVVTPTITAGGQTKNIGGKKVNTKLGGVKEIVDLGASPFLAPQLTLGTVVGTQITLRYLPEIDLEGYGKISWTGFGIQHNLGYWLPIPVVDVAASFYTQTVKIAPMFEMSGTSFGLNASKQFGLSFLNVTPYAGFMIESANFKVNYTPSSADFGTGVTPPTVNFEIEGENTSRLVVGLNIRLMVININADYNIGKYNSFTAGAFFAF